MRYGAGANHSSEAFIAASNCGDPEVLEDIRQDRCECIKRCTILHKYLVNCISAEHELRVRSEGEPTWLDEGDIVIDPFMGSGTTAVAAMQLNRDWIGIDNNKEYINLANKRILKHKKNTKLKDYY